MARSMATRHCPSPRVGMSIRRAGGAGPGVGGAGTGAGLCVVSSAGAWAIAGRNGAYKADVEFE